MPSPSPRAVVRLVAELETSVTLPRRKSSANVAGDGDEGDDERQQRGDDAAEDDQEQDEGERYGDRLGEDQVVDHLVRQVGAHRGASSGPDGEGVLVGAAVGVQDREGALPLLGGVSLSHGRAPWPHDRPRSAGPGCRVPEGDDVAEPLVLLELGHQVLAVLSWRRGVDAACGGTDQQDEIGLAAELVGDDVRRPGGG